MKQLTCVLIAAALLLAVSNVQAANDSDLQAQVQALQNRVQELEAKQTDQAVSQRNAELVRQMVAEMTQNNKGMAADTGVTAGYDKRFFIKSTDDQFRLEFDTLFQFRHSYLHSDDGSEKLQSDGTNMNADEEEVSGLSASASNFEVERARLQFSGHVLKDLNYRIVLESDQDSSRGTYLYEYELNYSFVPEFGARLGKYKVPFGKQEPGSSAGLMFVDRSLANDVFQWDRSEGVEAFGTIDLGGVKPEYRAMVFNGARSNENLPYGQNDNSPGAVGRLMLPLGGANSKDFNNESDIENHENPVAMLGGTFGYLNDRNENHFDANGSGCSASMPFLGKSAYDGKCDVFRLGGEMEQFGADASFKYQGFSTTFEGFYQHTKADFNDVTDAPDFGNGLRTGLMGDQMDNYGWYWQAGYFIVPKTFELAARIGGVCVDKANDSHEYAGGWNWYLAGNDLKLSMDITYIDDLPIQNSSSNYYGIQNNALLMVRSQLQFQF